MRGIVQTLKGHVLHRAHWFDLVQKPGQRDAGPRDDHGPPFHAPHSVNPLFQPAKPKHFVDIEYLWFVDHPVYRHGPRSRHELGRYDRDSFLVGSELVEIVVVRHALERGHRFINIDASISILWCCFGDQQIWKKRRIDRH